MQESLNQMVASVRRGDITPEDASRIIHGCAALLGLQLAEDIPETTLIVTGMRKSATREDFVAGFQMFGEIESAAVSSNQRGFGKRSHILIYYIFVSSEFHISLTIYCVL